MKNYGMNTQKFEDLSAGNEDFIIDLYYSKGRRAVAEFLGVRYNSVGHLLRKLGCSTKESCRRQKELRADIPKIRDLFTNPTPEGNYILGFILGDGSIRFREDRISPEIDISSKDKEILEKIIEALQYGKIYKKSRGNHSWYSLQIRDKFLGSVLISKGIVPRKSYVGGRIKYDPEFKYDFLRGLFDSDGCVSYNRNPNFGLRVSIVGHPSYMKDLEEEFSELEFIKGERGGLVRLESGDQSRIKRFYEKIYTGCDLFLRRKKERFDAYYTRREKLKY